jgi:hypothetical protein
MPWLGYLAMVKMVDVYVFYNDAEYIERAWYRRNRIYNRDKKADSFISITVKKPDLHTQINHVLINRAEGIRNLRAVLNASYDLYKRRDTGALFVQDLIDTIERYMVGGDKLTDVNYIIMRSIMNYLGMEDKDITICSSLDVPRLDRWNRLAAICDKMKCDTFYNGKSSENYMNTTDHFKAYNDLLIDYYFWTYNPVPYKQYGNTGTFMSHLSSLDAILSIPREEIIEVHLSPDRVKLELGNP